MKWTLITKVNMKENFLQMVDTMTMSNSHKPVFMLAFLDNMNDAGEVRLEDVARSFAAFYEDRLAHGLPAEKKEVHLYEERVLAEGCGTPNPFDAFQALRRHAHTASF